ncbi:uncharacterized protein N7479_002916 [Penicillium vulpinum]|uniref:uncharacterized protein n=1 Tax=Penicillium vulpinum TaxID=29845 RepID=UPI0025493D20|nr:uncharacterized protein N7479_002916 [Penicillium vulpinum]KAJ5972998.1 hypothetical protein N7479_002916 [Penicillium vulpinum]
MSSNQENAAAVAEPASTESLQQAEVKGDALIARDEVMRNPILEREHIQANICAALENDAQIVRLQIVWDNLDPGFWFRGDN